MVRKLVFFAFLGLLYFCGRQSSDVENAPYTMASAYGHPYSPYSPYHPYSPYNRPYGPYSPYSRPYGPYSQWMHLHGASSNLEGMQVDAASLLK